MGWSRVCAATVKRRKGVEGFHPYEVSRLALGSVIRDVLWLRRKHTRVTAGDTKESTKVLIARGLFISDSAYTRIELNAIISSCHMEAMDERCERRLTTRAQYGKDIGHILHPKSNLAAS